MTSLENVIHRWHPGWRASRDLPAAEVADDGLRIRCAQSSREVEILALHADEDPASVSRLAGRATAC
jgi:hypothetical protein